MIRTKNNELGIAHLLMLAMILVVVGAVGFTGYKVIGKKKPQASVSASQSTSASVSASSPCVSQLKDSDLCKFATNYNKLDHTSYSMNLTSKDSTGSSTMSLSQDQKGNTQGSFSSASFSYEAIDVDGYTYIKDESGNSYTRYPDSSKDAPPTSNPLKDLQLFEGNDYTAGGKLTFTKLGKETCGSLECFKYQVVDKTDSTNNATVWFDTKNFQLRRMLFADPTIGSVDLTLAYENVTVKAPASWHDLNQSQ